MAKQLIVAFYGENGGFEVKMTLTLKCNIAMTQEKARKIIAAQKLKSNRYTVSWVEGGDPDGYMVTPTPQDRAGGDGGGGSDG